MRLEQRVFTSVPKSSDPEFSLDLREKAQLAFVFGSRRHFENRDFFSSLRKILPQSHIMGCTASGAVCGTEISDDALSITAVHFEKTRIRPAGITVSATSDSRAAGEKLGAEMDKLGLRHVLVLSDGLKVNGSELVEGLKKSFPPSVGITGALAGDGTLFRKTLVCSGGEPAEGLVAALGFYGDDFKISFTSHGGWIPFGTERIITRSRGNILYEIDGQSALDLYQKLLDEESPHLPPSRFYFPLGIRAPEDNHTIIRTILSINEADKSLTFAGDMPAGHYARLMKANTERLIQGCEAAAQACLPALAPSRAELGLFFSCVGRKIVLEQRTEEELDSIRQVLGNQAVLAGFYSYGEIGPFAPLGPCQLHNQTVTLTTLCET